MNLNDLLEEAKRQGYGELDAVARVCQDIVLKAIAKSSLANNVTIKGGIVMRSLTGNVRRATQDMDIDFIRYPLTDLAIDKFIKKINCLDGITITRTGEIRELNQQDYRGKSIKVVISDRSGNHMESKIDFGVHKRLNIEQAEYCFDIMFDDDGASLLINSMEQMLVEKLKSLLKFGRFSTRYKDIYDIYYYCDRVEKNRIYQYIQIYVLDDPQMRENTPEDVYQRLLMIFRDNEYKHRVDKSEKRWVDDDIDLIFKKILAFINAL